MWNNEVHALIAGVHPLALQTRRLLQCLQIEPADQEPGEGIPAP